MVNSYTEAVMTCLNSEFRNGMDFIGVREAFEKKILPKISDEAF